MFNLAVILEDSARRFPNEIAISFMQNDQTFQDLNRKVNRLANAFKVFGLQKGDKIALSIPNTPYFPIVYFAALKAGMVVVPLNILLKSEEIAYHLENSDAKVYFCSKGSDVLPIGTYGWDAFRNTPSCKYFVQLEKEDYLNGNVKIFFEELITNQSDFFETIITEPNDTAIIIYTSGTTGHPKGAELSHMNLFCNANLVADLFQTKRGDKQLVVLPLFHIFGMTTMMNAGFFRGVHQVFVPKFDPAVIMENFHQYKINIFAGVPTMYWSLLNYKHENIPDDQIKTHLRTCVSGGASLPVQVLEDFEKRFEVSVLEGYGMSEGSPVVTFNDYNIGTKPGSIGVPVWGVEVKIVDTEGNELSNDQPGELAYKGHNVMKGYYKNPEATAEVLKDGWMHSGDVAYRDKDGFYFIVDRTKDMIIRGGMNVYSREIEEVLMKNPAISLAAVIGIPDEKLGEEIKAFVVLKEAVNVEPDILISWAKENLAVYKYPRIIEIVKELPLSATGKVLKKELRKNKL